MRFPDLSLAVRQAGRRPGFAVIAVLLMALGAGANAAVLSVVRSVLVRPLPYPEPDRLVAVWPNWFISNEDLDYWRGHLRGYDALAALAPGWMMGLVAEGGEPLKVTGAKTSDNLFTTLGVRAALGRTIEPGDAMSGRHRVVVLSDTLWRTRFAADRTILGRTVQLDQEPYVIVGVMPPAFEVFGGGTDLWVPLEWTPGRNTWKVTFSQAIGRLARGVTPEAATRELQALMPAMRRDLGRSVEWGRTARAEPLQRVITGDVRPALLILLGAVGLMLLLAAVNLGTLVMGRSVERLREMALRAALGASRARLARLILIEQVWLAAVGSAAGIALARAALPAIVARLPAEVPRAGEISLDWTVLIAVLAASTGVASAVALVPGMLAARSSLQPLLRQARSTDTPGRTRALGALVAAQVGLAVVLGVGASLMVRSLWNLQHVDPGFSPESVLTFRLQTTSKYRALGPGLPYLQRMVDRLRALPGVTAVGAAAHLPLSSYAWTIQVRRSDAPLAPGGQAPTVGWRFISWDYFGAMGIPVQYGRIFTAADTLAAQPVGILNETMARQYFGDPAAAVGRSVAQYGGGRPGEETVQVIGVVGDVRHLGLDQPPTPELFRPLAQTFMFPMAIVLRTSMPPAALAAAVRSLAYEVDPVIPVAELQPYTRLIAGQLARPRLLTFLLGLFGVSGLALVAVALYGVAAYRVRQREPEFGIRLALGADAAGIARGVLAQGLLQSAAGVAVGLPAALALSGVMSSVIFGVTARDPLSFAAVAIAVVAFTLAGCYLPARRAASVDPMTALRRE